MKTSNFAIINMMVCDRYKSNFLITRPHNLTLLTGQLSQLAHEDVYTRAAHAAYMLCKLLPFQELNQQTALCTALLIVDNSAKAELQQETVIDFARQLKRGAPVPELAQILRA